MDTGNSISNKVIGIVCIDLNSFFTGNKITGSLIQDILQIDTTGIVMASTGYNCGPAALATVMQKYFNKTASQDELTALAGTDENGTSMYGFAQTAQYEGLNAYGLKLSWNQLKPGNIVYLTHNGEGHFSVITSITDTMVYLADSDLGNINMTLSNFISIYSENALVITNNTNNSQLSNGTILTSAEMQSLVGSDWVYFGTGSSWTFTPPSNDYRTVIGPTVTGNPFTIGQSIDFHGASYSTTNYIVTVNNWGNNIAYLMACTLTIYPTSNWTGTPIYSATQYFTFLPDSEESSHTFSFVTPDLGGPGAISSSWAGTGYEPVTEGSQINGFPGDEYIFDPNRALDDMITLSTTASLLTPFAELGVGKLGAATILSIIYGVPGSIRSVIQGEYSNMVDKPWLKIKVNGKTKMIANPSVYININGKLTTF